MTCIDQPISWLMLERYALQELAAPERERVDEHLHACAICRACLAHVQAPRELPALVFPSSTKAVRRAGMARPIPRRWLAAAGALAAAAAVLLVLRPFGPGIEPPQRTIAIKGGELAMSLVRERRGSIALEPTGFVDGDRFMVHLTCPPPLRLQSEVVVFQAGEAYFPLAPATLAACGNAVALPGAFVLDGDSPARVCVVVSQREAISREQLRRHARGEGQLPPLSVCETLEPEAR